MDADPYGRDPIPPAHVERSDLGRMELSVMGRAGVWRPMPADAHRDRIVRAAEALDAVLTIVELPELVELRAAVAAGRAVTDA